MKRHCLRHSLHISWLVAVWCLGVTIGVIMVMRAPHGWFASLGWLLAGLVLLAPLFIC